MVARPHGGRLVLRVAEGSRRERLREEAGTMPRVEVSREVAVDVENIAYGAFSPLEGFMCSEDYHEVLYNMRLSNDLPWTLPIVLDVDGGSLDRGVAVGAART